MSQDQDDIDFEQAQRVPGCQQPKRRRRIVTGNAEVFVKVPLWWIKQVAEVTGKGSTTLVAIYLLHLRWQAKHSVFLVPNGQLEEKLGVSPDSKWRALRRLEKAGLITIQHRGRKSPLVTLRYL